MGLSFRHERDFSVFGGYFQIVGDVKSKAEMWLRVELGMGRAACQPA